MEQIAHRDHQRSGQSSSGGVQHHHSTQRHAFSSDNVEQRSDDDDEDHGAKNADEGIENDDEDRQQQQQWIRDRDRGKKFKTRQQKRRVEQLLKEQQEPTLGKYTTTIRPLDGFATNIVVSSSPPPDDQQQLAPRGKCLDTPGWVDINEDGCEAYEETDLPGCPKYGNDPRWIGNMGSASENCCYCRPPSNPDSSNTSNTTEEEEVVLLRRPTITSYSQRTKQSSSSFAHSSSTLFIADAHYAKALRMLQHTSSSSSPSLDNDEDGRRRITTTTDDKWNAVPHPIYNGEYTTSTNNRKRGDDFVHIDDYYNYDEYNHHGSSSSSSKGRTNNRQRRVGGSYVIKKKKKKERRKSQMAQRRVAQTKTAEAAAAAAGSDEGDGTGGSGVDVVNVMKEYIRNGGKYGNNEEELRQNVRKAIITAIENVEEDPPLFNMISEYIIDTIADMIDHVKEVFNVSNIMVDPISIYHDGIWFWRKWWWYSDDYEQFDEHENDDKNEEINKRRKDNNKNKPPSKSPTYYTSSSSREEDQFSLTDTHVVKGVLRTYRAIVRLLSSSIPRGGGGRGVPRSSYSSLSKSSWRSIWRRDGDDDRRGRLFDSSDDHHTSSSSSSDSHTSSTEENGSTTTTTTKTSNTAKNNSTKVVSLSRNDRIVIEGLFHLEKAAELGHAEAQRIVANSLASGILPLSDHSIMFRLAKWRYYSSQMDEGESGAGGGGGDTMIGGWSINNWTSTLLQSTIEVADDFSSTTTLNAVNNKTADKAHERMVNQRRQEQLSRAIILWHLSAMSGNVESAMTLGYRHFYSAMGGSGGGGFHSGAGRLFGLMQDDAIISPGYSMEHGGALGGTASASGSSVGGGSSGHYGVLGTCPTALAYYEAAAHGVMDELENGPTKAKMVSARYDFLLLPYIHLPLTPFLIHHSFKNPPLDGHRLAEIYTRGGASVALDSHNKPDELEEALQYYRMLASRSRSPAPDLTAAFTIANFYFNGYRGVKQDLRLALKYYEICGDYNHWEGGGLAGLMHVWNIGMTPEERDLGKAYSYFNRGTPGGIDSCIDRVRKKKRQAGAGNKDGDVVLCDGHSVNGMGLLHLLGVDGLVDRDVDMARRWFENGKDMGDPDSQYNYAMLRLGWMVTELEDIPTINVTAADKASTSGKPSRGGRHGMPSLDRNSYMTHRSTSLDHEDSSDYNGPSASDYINAIQNLQLAASKGHLQAKHKLGILYATGATIPKKYGSPTVAVTQSCASALRYFKGVADIGHTVSRRNRAAWKQYTAGEYESSLRNYLSSAETGNEIGQVNAAFLLEQGHCLGMTRKACTHASIRLWRAAARQGNLEACLRVGDFYFYGRMMTPRGRGDDVFLTPSPHPKTNTDVRGGHDSEYLSSLEAKALYFIPGPYRWTRYILYPEELFALIKTWFAKSLIDLGHFVSSQLSAVQPTDEVSSQYTCSEVVGETCSQEEHESVYNSNKKEEEYEHMAIAAQYYRRAAEEHNSARANFNLGFMHEWGLGLTQDFPLAKRHYDLAGKDNANKAAAIALFAMDIHQKAVKFVMYLNQRREESRSSSEL